MELYNESNFYEAPDHLKPYWKNQPQKFTGHGAAVKTLDHINFFSSNPEADGEFVETVLGLRLTEQIVMNDGRKNGIWYRATNKSYDIVYTKDATAAPKGGFIISPSPSRAWQISSKRPMCLSTLTSTLSYPQASTPLTKHTRPMYTNQAATGLKFVLEDISSSRQIGNRLHERKKNENAAKRGETKQWKHSILTGRRSFRSSIRWENDQPVLLSTRMPFAKKRSIFQAC